MAVANGNILVKNFQHVFRQLGQIKVSYYLDIGNFFYTKNVHDPKTKFGKIFFWAKKCFLTLELKSVNSNSSSFGKRVKRPINYFSQPLAQMAALGISRFLGPKLKKKKTTFHGFCKRQYLREKLTTRFLTIGPNKGELLFGYW